MNKIYSNIIIGSGITGLTIAKLLNSKNEDYLIIDKNDTIGGRVSTENYLDYKLDHGFQILLEDYPNLKIFPEIYDSGLRRLASGFIIKKKNALYEVLNPFRNVKGLLPSNTFPGFCIKDRYLLVKLLLLNKRYKNKKLSVKEFLKDFGFSASFINDFFISFFQGVFLNKDLDVPLKYFLFIFTLFSRSNVSIPNKGISQIASSIGSQLDSSKIILNTEVTNIKPNNITTCGGDSFYYKRLHCTDAGIEKLIDKKLYQGFFNDITYRGTQCFYFLSKMSDIDDNFIYLFPESKNITSMSLKRISKSELIISASSLSMEVSKNTIEKEVLSYFTGISDLKFLNSFKVPKALPSNPQFFNFQEKCFYQYNENIYFAGDYLSSPCLNGAIQSGINLVESIKK